MSKSIYELELHEELVAEIKWGVRTNITRVATGWIYQSVNRLRTGRDEYLQPVFVPFPEEQIFAELKEGNNEQE